MNDSNCRSGRVHPVLWMVTGMLSALSVATPAAEQRLQAGYPSVAGTADADPVLPAHRHLP